MQNYSEIKAKRSKLWMKKNYQRNSFERKLYMKAFSWKFFFAVAGVVGAVLLVCDEK